MVVVRARKRWWVKGACAVFLLLGGGPQGVPARATAQSLPQTHVLIVTGVSGEPRFANDFHQHATALRTAATQKFGVADSLITYLAEDPARDPKTIRDKSTRENVARAVEAVRQRSRTGDVVFIVLIGHGASMDNVGRFSLPGPDLSSSEFAKMLEPFADQTVVFVNASSASGDFVKPLSGKKRIIVTATKSGSERNESIFAKHFVAAFTGDGADADKDGRVSVLEAFVYARREVEREYTDGNKLLTEHAVLDDDGDGVGRPDPSATAADGGRARTVFLGLGAKAAAVAASDPRAATLIAEKARLDARLDSLRARKANMSDADYQRELEAILLLIAENDRAIKALEGRKP
jgi:hypothetical protein